MRWLRPFVFVALAPIFTASSVRADDATPLSRAELDRRSGKTAYDVVELGSNLFNGGKQEACYWLYEGALRAILPNLDHRPDVMKLAKDRLDRAASLRNVSDKAFALREALDAIMKYGDIKKPLWDRLGGEAAVRAVVRDFVAVAAPDPKVNFFRDGKIKIDDEGGKRLEQSLVELVSAVSGGPLKYSGRDMKTVHAGMKITDAEFDAIAGHLVATLKKYKVPQAEIDELVGIVETTRKDIVEVKK